ncbi:MAG: phenylalanine--tRNA ligase subunit beta [Chloroflexi bacterium]|nr:phenylalanine--tRNA ligase subunit beta [Chloroflexota bacterium]
MKILLSWLKEYVDVTLPVSELAQKLTMAGLEVKGTEVIGGNWDNIIIGQIVAINPHPNADRLTLPTVDLGTERVTVVCGAPNLKIGDKIAFARVGAQLIDGHTGKLDTLKTAKIRGVVSNGMVCSEKELGISARHDGIMVLSPDAPIGAQLGDYLGDAILSLDITPNRADCLSVIGIAREVSALTGQSLHVPEVRYEEATPAISEQVTVEIKAPDLCPRYCASLITGVKLAESPGWMQQRLLACGMRPINNVVDITNYVMLEYGQPLHAFDYERIKGKKIIVRRAASGEHIVTLDGAERVLTGDMLVIADEEHAVAVAGVMGGASSEVMEGTTSILLEAASFQPTSIHHTGRILRLPSEACMRFERGIRAELTLPALKRATQLMQQLAGGKVAQGLIDGFPGKRAPEPILLSTGEVKRLLGVEFTVEQMTNILSSAGFECQQVGPAPAITVMAPYWRNDIHLTVDLIEEIARLSGYDKIPTTMLSQPIPRHNPEPIIGLKREVRRSLAGHGFQEIITFSLTGLEILTRLSPGSHPPQPLPLRVVNPMTADQEYLRPNLRASLLTALATNRRREDGGIRLFELGRVYLRQSRGLPDEREVLCSVMSGLRFEKSWRGSNELIDFFDAKGVVEVLLNRFGVAVSFEPGSDESLQANKQARIIVGGNRIGVVGELHPKVLENFEVSGSACLFELDLPALVPFTQAHWMFKPVPRFPSIVRDIALVVSTSTTHRQILDVVSAFPLVEEVALFDVYTGEQVPRGKKSLAYRLTFQSPAHTLTDDEVDKVQQQILDKLSGEFGATLRS